MMMPRWWWCAYAFDIDTDASTVPDIDYSLFMRITIPIRIDGIWRVLWFYLAVKCDDVTTRHCVIVFMTILDAWHCWNHWPIWCHTILKWYCVRDVLPLKHTPWRYNVFDTWWYYLYSVFWYSVTDVILFWPDTLYSTIYVLFSDDMFTLIPDDDEYTFITDDDDRYCSDILFYLWVFDDTMIPWHVRYSLFWWCSYCILYSIYLTWYAITMPVPHLIHFLIIDTTVVLLLYPVDVPLFIPLMWYSIIILLYYMMIFIVTSTPVFRLNSIDDLLFWWWPLYAHLMMLSILLRCHSWWCQ